jgi:hypothetical protein
VENFLNKRLFSISLTIKKYILNGSDDGVEHSGLLGFWNLSIVRYTEEHSILETGYVSVFGWGVGNTYIRKYSYRGLAIYKIQHFVFWLQKLYIFGFQPYSSIFKYLTCSSSEEFVILSCDTTPEKLLLWKQRVQTM